jgi:hypothetical protein
MIFLLQIDLLSFFWLIKLKNSINPIIYCYDNHRRFLTYEAKRIYLKLF